MEQLQQLLNKRELSHREGDFKRLLRRSVRVRSAAATGGFHVGASRLGGFPDLPADSEWPKDQHGTPLAFIGQFNMAEISPLEEEGLLPASGFLYFFYDATQSVWGFDPNDRGSWRVLYFDVDSSGLAPRTPPGGLAEEGRYLPCTVTFEKEVTIPSANRFHLESLGLSDEEFNSYFDLNLDDKSALYGAEPYHRMLGYADDVQGEMEVECQLVSHGLYCGDSSAYYSPEAAALEPGARDWRLLLQVDTDDTAGMMWGDMGRIYFWITEQNLRARRFEDVWLILQCS